LTPTRRAAPPRPSAPPCRSRSCSASSALNPSGASRLSRSCSDAS